jgi:hypothetical protein
MRCEITIDQSSPMGFLGTTFTIGHFLSLGDINRPEEHIEHTKSKTTTRGWGRDDRAYSVLYSIGTVPAASKERVDTIETRRSRRGLIERREVEGSFPAMVMRAGAETCETPDFSMSAMTGHTHDGERGYESE